MSTDVPTGVEVTSDVVYQAIYDAAHISSDVVYRAIYDVHQYLGVALPPGSHLWLYGENRPARGERGVDVVRIRESRSGYPEVMNSAGHWISLDRDVRLVNGRVGA